MWEVIQNRRLIFGDGAINQVGEIIKSTTEKKVFVLAFSLKADAVISVLEKLSQQKIDFVADDSIIAEPTTDDINRLAESARANGCGAVLAVGGGSVLDAAKSVAMLVTNGGRVEQYQMEGKPIDKPTLPLFAAPTTSGTGSEATKVSVVYNPASHLKKSFYSPYMIADTVILDPRLTVGLPKTVTVSTGIDALSHAIESYVSLNATTYTQMYGISAMKLVIENLEACIKDGSDIQARSGMLLASYFGGCAINAGIGLAHIIAQPLGGLLKVPHGEACAVFLPHAMEYNLEYSLEKYCDIARIFGVSSQENTVQVAKEGVSRVKAFLKAVNAPDNIKAYIPSAGFSIEEATQAVQGATSHIKCNPRPVDSDIVRHVISKVI
jgi:alcohol dehydrogenase class IV